MLRRTMSSINKTLSTKQKPHNNGEGGILDARRAGGGPEFLLREGLGGWGLLGGPEPKKIPGTPTLRDWANFFVGAFGACVTACGVSVGGP